MIKTDVLIIGAGPVGLFAVHQLGVIGKWQVVSTEWQVEHLHIGPHQLGVINVLPLSELNNNILQIRGQVE